MLALVRVISRKVATQVAGKLSSSGLVKMGRVDREKSVVLESLKSFRAQKPGLRKALSYKKPLAIASP